MPISTLQFLALLNIPRIGKRTALKLSKLFEISPTNDEFVKKLSESNGYTKNPIPADSITKGLIHAQNIIDQSEKHDIHYVNIYEDNYPQSLRNAVSENGKSNIAPPVIFYKGDIKLLKKKCLLIIGSRKCSAHSKRAAIYLSEKFSERGFSIVSGLALGCDSAAHEGAIKTGKTIALVGNGLDSVYPSENKELSSEILSSGGLILSEYEIGTPPNKYNLVERDLLQAAISNAVIVIQSSKDGGSMHAAITALNSGKKVYTVKFSDELFNDSEECSGNRELVSKFGASYIEASADRQVMESYLDKISAQI